VTGNLTAVNTCLAVFVPRSNAPDLSGFLPYPPLTLSVTGPGIILSPVDTTASVTVSVGGLSVTDTAEVTIDYIQGITFNNTTNTLIYDGIQAFATPSQTITFMATASGYRYATATLTIEIRDGGDALTRVIPVTSENITRPLSGFNIYSNTPAGLTKHYMLASNIVLTAPAPGGSNWTPIGSFSPMFTGSFNGNNFSVSGLVINREDNNQAMFAYIGTTGSVVNLGLVDVNITGRNNTGGIAGTNMATIQNCSVFGIIGGSTAVMASKIGGITGENIGMIDMCFFDGNIVGEGSMIGGIAGINDTSASILNCYTPATATLSGAGGTIKGGIAGDNLGMVRNCYSASAVTGFFDVGGIVGRSTSSGTVQNCVALNTGVAATGGSSASDLGRVIGSNFLGGTFTNNHARNPMTITYGAGSTAKPITSGLTTVDGLNITSTQWTDPDWWRDTAFTGIIGTDAWTWWAAGKLPVTLS